MYSTTAKDTDEGGRIVQGIVWKFLCTFESSITDLKAEITFLAVPVETLGAGLTAFVSESESLRSYPATDCTAVLSYNEPFPYIHVSESERLQFPVVSSSP